ncbi:MAG: TnpV protein [Lachnospiraceae bacterium]|nr:TnpV protein [Lachnospiraceae bacterium]
MEPAEIGKYGMLRRTYLKEHHQNWYQSLWLSGKLNRHLSEIDRAANERMEVLMEQLSERFPAPDKAADQLAWAAHMNNLTAMAEETVLTELVYN